MRCAIEGRHPHRRAQSSESVSLVVIGAGMGILTDHRTEIFEGYRQPNNPARDGSLGLGLGLAIVSRLARFLAASGLSGS